MTQGDINTFLLLNFTVWTCSPRATVARAIMAATCGPSKEFVTGTKKQFGMCCDTGKLVPGIVMLVPRPTSSASLLTPAIQTIPLAAH